MKRDPQTQDAGGMQAKICVIYDSARGYNFTVERFISTFPLVMKQAKYFVGYFI